MVCLYVNVQFQVKPLITGTSSRQTKKNYLCLDPDEHAPSWETVNLYFTSFIL